MSDAQSDQARIAVMSATHPVALGFDERAHASRLTTVVYFRAFSCVGR
jgi:hypothetical protein